MLQVHVLHMPEVPAGELQRVYADLSLQKLKDN